MIYSETPKGMREIRKYYGGKLIVALDENDKLIFPKQGVHGFCPECKKPVVAKTPRFFKNGLPSIRGHFAHLAIDRECGIHQREESEWHLQHKAVFPIDWCEKIVKREDKKYRIVDVCSPVRAYTIDYESSLSGRDVSERDQFYFDSSIRSSWVFKSSISRFKDNFEVISLNHKTLSEYELAPKSKSFYDYIIDKNPDRCVLIRGDLPISHYTKLHGSTMLCLSGHVFLDIMPDKVNPLEVDISNEWVFAAVLSPAEYIQYRRPGWRADFNHGTDPSAIRAKRYVDESSEFLKKNGGPKKAILKSTRSSFVFLKSIQNAPSENEISLYRIKCEYDELSSFTNYIDTLSNKSIINLLNEVQEIEEINRRNRTESLELYRKKNIKIEEIDYSIFSNVNILDHSESCTFTGFDENELSFLKSSLEDARSKRKAEEDKLEIERQQAERDRLERLEKEKQIAEKVKLEKERQQAERDRLERLEKAEYYKRLADRSELTYQRKLYKNLLKAGKRIEIENIRALIKYVYSYVGELITFQGTRYKVIKVEKDGFNRMSFIIEDIYTGERIYKDILSVVE